MQRNDLLSIGKLSSIMGISIDTLRYYDKIDLFKPFITDPQNGYRYYSILQYEKIGTIVELRELGLSIDEIKMFMEGRNVEKSLSVLKEQHKKLREHIQELEKTSAVLGERISHVEEFRQHVQPHHVQIKEFGTRYYFRKKETVILDNPVSLSYGIVELEKTIKEKLPLLANSRIGHVFHIQSLHAAWLEKSPSLTSLLAEEVELFILLEENVSLPDVEVQSIVPGKYICVSFSGLNNHYFAEALTKLFEYCSKYDITIKDYRAWNIIQIDISITDIKEEAVYEIQLLIDE